MNDIEEVLKYSRQLSLLHIANKLEEDRLRKFFPRMQTASTVEEAIALSQHYQKMRSRFFDLIVIDCDMGVDVYHTIRARNDRQKLIILSRNGCDIFPFLKSGVSHVIADTLHADALAEAIFHICKDIYYKHRLEQYVHTYKLLKGDYDKSRLECEDRILESKEQLTRKSNFLAGISHEIRTPMNAIIGFGGLLLKEELNEKARDYALKITNSAGLLLGIINDVLDYSKIEAGKLKIEAIEFDINMILDHVADMVGMTIKEKGLELIFDIDHQVRPSYIGDPTRISQIILNLISNAVKFTDKGGKITLKIHALSLPQNHQQLQFEVSDTGIGMSETQSKQLFERYVQADESTARKFGGTGLGLSICKQLLDLMGGRIWVQSQPGVGSTFSFVIEFGVSHPDERRVYHLPRKELMQQRILIIDRHPNSADSLRRMLGYFHMGVDCADSLESASEFLDRKRYDMIFVDEQILDVCSIRSFLKEDLPRIVLLESRINEVKHEMCGDYKIDAYLYKPFNQQMVLNVFNELYGERQLFKSIEKRHFTKEELSKLSGNRVLMAEDNRINQKVMLGILNETGIKLEVVDDGVAALHAVEEKGPYDLVLMDINMPGMNGYEATEAIRKIYDPETMPIVALTADVMAEDIEKVKEHGMQEYLTKPIDVVSLYDTLFRYLHQRKESGITEDTKEEEDPRYYRLAQIPQFDSDTALERVGGSKSLYLSLVEDFINIYRDASVKVRSFNAGKEYAEGIHYMHDFKGAAGNIGSIVLFTLAKSIEEGYRHHDDAALAKLADELEGTLRDVTVQIEYALFPERQKKEDGALDIEHTGLLRNLLRSARKKKVLESVNLINKLRETEWPKSHYKPLYDVIMALEQYRFSDAVEKLEAMGIEEAR